MRVGAISTMTSKGQLTVPKAVRKAMGLRAGSEIRFEVDPTTGQSLMAPIRFALEDLWAYADESPRLCRTMTFEEMRRAKIAGASR